MLIDKENIIKYSNKYDSRVKGSFDEYGEKELKEWLNKIFDAAALALLLPALLA